jgi:arylsulfatase A-like enzyme
MSDSRSIVADIIAGSLGGAWGGTVVGLAEATVITLSTAPGEEYWLFPYAIVSYGMLGMVIGLGCTVVGAAFVLQRVRHATLGLGASAAFFLIGYAVARYHIIQRVFGEELVTMSGMGLTVHAGIFVCVGALALALLYGGRWAQRCRSSLALQAVALAAGFGVSCGAAVLASPHAPEPVASRPRRAVPPTVPNIILIILDTLRADALGSYGAPATASPVLDAFAREAVRFENTYSQSSWTRPSIATILTSLYPSEHGAIHKMDALPDQVTTVAEALRANGYWTAGFVSNINVAPVFNFQQGFDEYTYLAPYFYFWATDSATQLAIYKGLRLARERFWRDRIYFYNYYQDAEVVTGAVTQWVEHSPPMPFFLFIHFMDPHDPYFEHPYNGRGVARVSNPNPPASRKDELHALYAGDVAYLDRHLGTLFSRLKSAGLYENTIIAVTADHGEEFQEHGGWWHGTSLYQEVVHVPLIVKRAHEERPGQVETHSARALDIAPTLMAAAGLTIPHAFVGRDLFGPAAAEPEPLFAEEELEGNVLASLRVGPWKVITANTDNPRGLQPLELYNLDQDAQERHNLALTEQARTEQMLQLLARERARVNDRNQVTGRMGPDNVADNRS